MRVRPRCAQSSRHQAFTRATEVKRRRTRSSGRRPSVRAAPVTAAELRALRRELAQRMRPAPRTQRVGRSKRRKAAPARWNPDPDDVQRSVAQLVLTIVEFLRTLMERQAIRRMEEKTLSKREIEAVGAALMKLEQTALQIG